jgi:sugar lactone lactonase YvrE
MSPRPDVVLHCADEVGESPVWDEREGCLRWVDLLRGAVRSVTGAGRVVEVETGCAVGAICLTDTGDLVAAVRDGFARLSPRTGAVDLLAPVEAHDPRRRMNDGKCDPWGGFVAGTMVDDQSTPTGTLYRLGSAGEVTAGESGFTCPNGLDWSLDGGTLYHTDTPTGRIDVCELDPDTHLPIAREPFVRLDGPGAPDGMTLDSDGCLWVAMWGGGSVRRYTPQGRLDQVVDLPVAQPASCAFGGPGRRTLFVTTARHGLSERELAAQPLAGAMFAVDGLAQGMPAHRFPLSRRVRAA